MFSTISLSIVLSLAPIKTEEIPLVLFEMFTATLVSGVIHESGHYVAGKLTGTQVLEFQPIPYFNSSGGIEPGNITFKTNSYHKQSKGEQIYITLNGMVSTRLTAEALDLTMNNM